MSRVRNADEFLIRFRKIQGDYERIFGSRIAKIRSQYAGKSKPEQDLPDQQLEAHAREYFVNAFLAALNWRLDARPEDGLPNLVPEAPIRSAETGRIRFLDYLGLERGTDNPLLIVETKRPSAGLPRNWEPAATYSDIVSRGLAGEPLYGDWNRWLNTLRDYVRSVHQRTQKVPRRVLITNGKWLIVFLDPSDAFLENGTSNPNKILVFVNRDDIERRYTELFREVEHSRVLGEAPPLTSAELPFYVEGSAVDRVMHGLRLKYGKKEIVRQNIIPVISIAPVVFLRSQYGTWFRVETPPTVYFEIPNKTDDFSGHLTQVQEAAEQLLAEVQRGLKTELKPISLVDHYNDHDEFATLPGVRELEPDEFLVVTGDKTHYLLSQPSVLDCPYHDWEKCNTYGVPSNPGPIVSPSVSPRSFFRSGESYHCAHRDVYNTKATPITAANRDRCGPRSGQDGQAFCEIWRFEQYLCCRTCVFEEVCTSAKVFHLPCEYPDHRTT